LGRRFFVGIALFSDVHGNLTSLEAVLSAIAGRGTAR